MKKYIFFLLFILFSVSGRASTVLASSFGYNPDNASEAFANAINSPNDTIIIDLQPNTWNVGPNSFFDLTDKTIIFEPGVVLHALPGEFDDVNANLLRFVNCSNVRMVGYGATLKMNKSEYIQLDDSEHRMSINLYGCSDFTILGFIIDESGGDGIYIGGDGGYYCENIYVEDVQCINHYRQGMSITSAKNVTIRNSLFANTRGALPEAGIDIEPYEITQRIENIKIENCRFENNGWSGLALALTFMDETSPPVSIEVRDCVFRNNCRPENTYAKAEILASADTHSPVKGNILIERCLIEESDYSAFYTRNSADAYHVTFKDCAFLNVSKLQNNYNNPVFFEVGDYFEPSPKLGNIDFDNVFISYNTDFGFIHFHGSDTLEGLKDITGHFTIVEPFGNEPEYYEIPEFDNVSFTFTSQMNLPETEISIEVIDPVAIECDETPAIYRVSRNSDLMNYPLGILYNREGTVTFGDDVHLPTDGWVIPTNDSEKNFFVYPRQDGIPEESEDYVIEIEPNDGYVVGNNNTITLFVEDNITAVINNENGILSAFPTDGEYQWINCAGMIPIEGEINSVFIPHESGSYAVEITRGECIAISECEEVDIMTVKEKELNRLKVYPVPAKEYLIVETPQKTEITIFNIKGQTVLRKALHSGENKIKTAAFLPGVYFIKEKNGTRVKVLIE